MTNKLNNIQKSLDNTNFANFSLQATSDSLKTIVDCFVKDGTFDGEKVTSSAKTKYEDAIYAFYKVLEHTKLAYTQYQNLYKKTENEVQELYSVTQESIEEYKKLKKVAHELR